MVEQTTAHLPERAIEGARFIEGSEPQVFQAWRRLLRQHWGDLAEGKLNRIDHDSTIGRDLFSMALDTLVDCVDPSERDLSVLVAKVRRLDYSIADLFGELTCLADAVEEVLQGVDRLHQADLQRFLGRVRHQVRLLFAAVLDQTAAVYEAVTENAGCGYCQVDDNGVIVFANAEMHRLLGADATDVVLPNLFGDDGAFVLEAIRGDYGQNPGIRRLKMRRSDGSGVAVNISPAPLYIDERKRRLCYFDRRIEDRRVGSKNI